MSVGARSRQAMRGVEVARRGFMKRVCKVLRFTAIRPPEWFLIEAAP
jgi:hypothetical protein